MVRGFVIPNVKVVKGGRETLKALEFLAAGKANLEKLTIQHPLKEYLKAKPVLCHQST